MTPEQMTIEELAHELLSGDWAGHAKDLTDEAAHRLRNSIPKPVVDIWQDEDGVLFNLRVNGRRCGRFIYDSQHAKVLAEEIRQALGMEGGGDE